MALCAYVLAALFAERRQHEAALADGEARLQEALTAGAVSTFVWAVGTGASQRSANAAQFADVPHHGGPFGPVLAEPHCTLPRAALSLTVRPMADASLTIAYQRLVTANPARSGE